MFFCWIFGERLRYHQLVKIMERGIYKRAMRKGEKMLTTIEVMERLNAPYQTVISWIKKGLLESKREDTPRGPVYYVPLSAVETFTEPKRGRPRKPLSELKGRPRRKEQ
jgi:hypothetical protein